MTGTAPLPPSALPSRPQTQLHPPADDASILQRAFGWIWRVGGTLDLPPGQSTGEALDRLAPLLGTPGTHHERTGDALVFIKRDAAAQDRLAVFDSGVLRIVQDADQPVLRFDLVSRSLLACFVAPLLFLGFAQVMLYTEKRERAEAAAEEKAEKAKEAKDAKTGNAKAVGTKKPAKKELVLNPIDAALGAPAPKTRKQMAADKAEKDKEPPSAKPAYVFAGIFAALYLIGRILEAWLAKKLFRKALFGE